MQPRGRVIRASNDRVGSLSTFLYPHSSLSHPLSPLPSSSSSSSPPRDDVSLSLSLTQLNTPQFKTSHKTVATTTSKYHSPHISAMAYTSKNPC